MSTTIINPIIERLDAKASEVDLAPLEAAMTYTLADAVRDGASCSGAAAVGHFIDQRGNICALSAAYLAAKARHLL